MKGIITLCGSTRFYKTFDLINYFLTINDWIVLSIGCHTKGDFQIFKTTVDYHKEDLDKLHKEKINISQAIFVIDVDQYIGESTKSEIAHALQLGKKIYYLSAELENPTMFTKDQIDEKRFYKK